MGQLVAARFGSDSAGVIERIYAAAEHEREWPEALCATSQHLGCDITSLEEVELDRPLARSARFGGLSPAEVDAYLRRWAPLNPLLADAKRAARAGQLMPGSRLVANDEPLDSPYAEGFLQPLGVRYAAATCIECDSSQAWLLGLMRSEAGGAFARREHDACRELVPHLRRVIGIRRQLTRGRELEETVATLVGAVRDAVIVLDRHGRVVGCNEIGQRLLDRHDGLVSRRGALVSADAQAGGLLDRAIELVCSGRRHEGVISVSVPRRGLASYSVSLMRLPKAQPQGPAAVVVVAESAPLPARPDDLLRRFFGLTRVEARVALLLPDAPSVRDLATGLGTGYQTVRTHLRRIYAKTGSHSQRDLVRLVLALPAERMSIRPGPVAL